MSGTSDRRKGHTGVGQRARIRVIDVQEVAPLGEVAVLQHLSGGQHGATGEACILGGSEDLRPGVGTEPRLGYGRQLAMVLGPAFRRIESRVVHQVGSLDHPGEVGPHPRP